MTTATFGQRFFAGWYPGFMARVERAGQAEVRRTQLARAHGRTLEIGAGNGVSVPHYPRDLDALVLLEPNPALRARLAARTDPPATTSIVDGDAHNLDFPAASFDTVTASLVFCSVRDPARALREVHRVLRPGGQFLFHEHVRGTGVRATFQDLITPLQRRLADGCHANRDFESLLTATDFHIEEIEHTRMPTRVASIVPMVVGSARKQ
ncbi:class I SAM-dependent methyltransferase [Nocardia sp. alder85J]|uniref:class I SAM-dependent methyltransferase n=1 Tax=Nocardia sp. alder85J TaxID=2862949 RepID=UPI001CD6BB39|nr:class I SAM-dependent methyltransferase [Nocardia sp. alder85J]MCX4090938.1 class I SAM-dependent methyltransferase [Nocardia sp. alder85J]